MNRTARALAPLALLVAVVAAGCSSNGSGSADGSGASAVAPGVADRAGDSHPAKDAAADPAGVAAESSPTPEDGTDQAAAKGLPRAVIREGDVSLRAEDV